MNNTYESLYTASTSIEHRKKYAQFFTPASIANIMAEWVLGCSNLESVLDPAFGLGALTNAVLSKKPDIRVYGFDIDDLIYSNAYELFKQHSNVSISKSDYITSDFECKYDGIISNPPYMKYSKYNNEHIGLVEERLGINLSRTTNLYALFLLKSIYQMKSGGRLAYIVPSEFLNSNYGALVKKALLDSGTLRHISVFDFKSEVFEYANTTACIIFCANDANTGFSFSNISNDSLSEAVEFISEYPSASNRTYGADTPPYCKWKTYYKKTNDLAVSDVYVPFSNIARAMRGITTGCNDYFMMSKKEALMRGISERSMLKCIGKALQGTAIFKDSDFNELSDSGMKMYLFNATAFLDASASDYIKIGECSGVDKRYITSSRNPWYSLEKRNPAPILASVFIRNGGFFLRNETDAVNLSCYHGIYPFSDIAPDFLFAYLLTPSAKEAIGVNLREYGRGLSKLEPNDINSAMVLNIRLVTNEQKAQIMKLYGKYMVCVDNAEKESIVNSIDSIFNSVKDAKYIE